MLINLNEFLMSVSFALDFVERDLLGVSLNHSKRVAYISLKIAEVLKLTPQEIHDVVALAILHDNGVSEKSLQDKLNKKDRTNINILESVKEHCIIGEENIHNYPFFTDVTNIIKYHHEKYDGSGFFGLKGNEIPLSSQIIEFADTLEITFNLQNASYLLKEDILSFMKIHENTTFSPLVVKAFSEAMENTSFWLDLKDIFLDNAIKRGLPSYYTDLSLDGIHKITNVLSKIIDSKSQYTEKHSKGLSEKIYKMSQFYKKPYEEQLKLIISANLHDIGKLAVPNVVLDKPGKLTNDEFSVVKEHSYYTRVILQQVKGFEDITEWASNHHEKLDGKGYPYGLSDKKLDFNSRLMACLDIYQALTEERPYRRSLAHEEAMDILCEMKLNGSIDGKIVEDINYVFKS